MNMFLFLSFGIEENNGIARYVQNNGMKNQNTLVRCPFARPLMTYVNVTSEAFTLCKKYTEGQTYEAPYQEWDECLVESFRNLVETISKFK